MDDIEKDLTTMRYRNTVNCCSYGSDNVSDNRKELKDREKIAKQIAKTSDSIRKKYCALKIDKMEKDRIDKTL